MPILGAIVLLIQFCFPGSREHRRARKAARALAPDAELRKRAEELELCGSLDNRMALAAECMNHRMYAEAARLYESCLAGAYAADGALLFALARAAVEGGDRAKALPAIERLKAAAPRLRPLEVRLLEARIHEARGDYDAALAVYRDIVPQFVGLEARYRYGRLLLRLGRREAAMETFNEVVKHAKRFTSAIEDEAQWAEAARQAIS